MINFGSKKTYPCVRCDGKGRLNGFGHVWGGVCFKCGGSGTQVSKPSTRTWWAVHLPKIVEHPTTFTGPDFVYMKSGKTQKDAIGQAVTQWHHLKSALKSEVTIEGAWAEPREEYLRRFAS